MSLRLVRIEQRCLYSLACSLKRFHNTVVAFIGQGCISRCCNMFNTGICFLQDGYHTSCFFNALLHGLIRVFQGWKSGLPKLLQKFACRSLTRHNLPVNIRSLEFDQFPGSPPPPPKIDQICI